MEKRCFRLGCVSVNVRMCVCSFIPKIAVTGIAACSI